MTLVVYTLCKHIGLIILVASHALQQITEVGAVTRQVDIIPSIECTCKIEWYTILMLGLSLLGLVLFVILLTQKHKLCRGHLFYNAVKIKLFISDTQYYVPIKLCRMAGNIDLFRITEILTPEHLKLKINILCDVLELDWKGVNVTLSVNKVNLPSSVTIKFQEKFKIRHIVQRETFILSYCIKARFHLVCIGFQ